MKIENNTEKVRRGTYAIVAQLNGGTGTTLSISIAGGTPIAIEDGAFTADATKIIELPDCEISGVSGGGSFADLTTVEGGFY